MVKRKHPAELKSATLPIQVSKQKDLKSSISEQWGVDYAQPFFPSLETLFKVDRLDNVREYGLKLDDPIQTIHSKTNITTSSGRTRKIHIKQTMLVSPFKWMRGDYGGAIGLPSTQEGMKQMYDKIQLPHNAAYVGSLFSAAFSLSKCIHFPEVYGVYTGIAKEHKIDISDDYEDLVDKSWFSQNVGKYFDLKLADTLNQSDFHHTRNAKLQFRMEEDVALEDIGELDGIPTETPSVPEMNAIFDEEEESDDIESDASSVSTSYIFEIDSCNCSESSDDTSADDLEEYDDPFAWATFSNVPVQLTVMEQCEGTLYDLLCLHKTDTEKHMAWLTQVLFALTFAQRTLGFIHNDLHSNNIMYVRTDKEYLYYKVDGQSYKVPTHGYILKIIDFERGTGSIRLTGMAQPKMFVSDHFSPNEEAGGQYNIEPFHVQGIDTIKPNPSFDLVRLATSLFWDLFPKGPYCETYASNPIFNSLIRWLTLENKTSILFGKKDPEHERYHGFDLYKAIARYCKDSAIPRKEVQKLTNVYGETLPVTTLYDMVLL